MKNGFRVIDSEPHIMEPFDLWERQLPEPYRSRTRITAPPQGHLEQGGNVVWIEGVAEPPKRDNPLVRRRSLRRMVQEPHLVKTLTLCNPEVFLEGFDIEGIDVGVLMPTLAMGLVRYDDLDPNHALAFCQVFNDYAYEFTRKESNRLKFWGWLPPHDAELAADEARRCMVQLGATGVAMTKGAVNGHLLCDEFFDPLWRELNDLGAPLGLHGPGGGALKDNIAHRYHGHPGMETLVTALRSPFHAESALGELIFGGVLERYPQLMIVSMESNASWLPWLLWRLDEKFEMNRPDLDIQLSLKPSEYFLRQCYAVVEPEEVVIKYTIDYLGDRNLLFSTDYPHNDCLFPNAVDTFLALEGVSADSKRRILWDNGAGLYGLEKENG